MSTPVPPAKATSDKSSSPAKSFMWGVLFLAGAVAMYFYIGNAEQTGDSFTLPIILAPVYKLIGKWGIVGVIGVVGLLSLGMGVLELRDARVAKPTAQNVEQPVAD